MDKRTGWQDPAWNVRRAFQCPAAWRSNNAPPGRHLSSALISALTDSADGRCPLPARAPRPSVPSVPQSVGQLLPALTGSRTLYIDAFVHPSVHPSVRQAVTAAYRAPDTDPGRHPGGPGPHTSRLTILAFISRRHSDRDVLTTPPSAASLTCDRQTDGQTDSRLSRSHSQRQNDHNDSLLTPLYPHASMQTGTTIANTIFNFSYLLLVA